MSEETKFPEIEIYGDYHTTEVYVPEDVNDWIQRCIKDYPYIYDNDDYSWSSPPYRDSSIDDWFSKWFSQFKQRSDDVK